MFARRGIQHPKGTFGREQTLAANSGFPKHKELFTEGYYDGEPGPEEIDEQFQQDMSSPLNKRFEKMNEMYSRDAIRHGKHDYIIPKMGGGILKNYKKLTG